MAVGCNSPGLAARHAPAEALVTPAACTALATPSRRSTRIVIQVGSNSYQASPCRAEVGCEWCCCASLPKVSNAPTSCCGNRRGWRTGAGPHVRRGVHQPGCMQAHHHADRNAHSIIGSPPKANNSSPRTTIGTQW